MEYRLYIFSLYMHVKDDSKKITMFIATICVIPVFCTFVYRVNRNISCQLVVSVTK